MSAQEPCDIILQHLNKARARPINLFQCTLAECYLGATDYRMRPVVPFIAGGKIFYEDEHVGISLRTRAQDGIDISDSTVRIPITLKNMKTRLKEPVELGKDGQYAMTFLADGTVFQAEVEKLWGYWAVPLGHQVVLGKENTFNSRIYVIPMDDT